jgi:hypothetical protein
MECKVSRCDEIKKVSWREIRDSQTRRVKILQLHIVVNITFGAVMERESREVVGSRTHCVPRNLI